MPVPLEIDGITYQYPSLGDENWGIDATDWAIAVTQSINNLQVPGDLGPTTNVTILNNQSSAANVTNCIIDSSINRAAFIEYFVYRSKGATELIETGNIRAVYVTGSNSWVIDRTYDNGADMNFDMNSSGQLTYTSSNMVSVGSYIANMRYRVRVLPL